LFDRLGRRRSGRRLRGGLGRAKLRLERAQTIAVLLLDRVELFSQLLDLLSQRLGIRRLR
jgi:hypothetical protein